MFDIKTEIILITLLAGVAVSLPGAFVVLKNDYPSSDITSKSSVFGFVLVSMLFPMATLPVYIIIATITGFIGFYLVLKFTNATNLDNKYFSATIPSVILAVALVFIMDSSSTKIDLNTILFGELALVPFDRLVMDAVDYGSIIFYVLLFVILLNMFSIFKSYKSLTSLCIDADFGRSIKLDLSKTNMLLAISSALSMSVTFYIGGAIMMIAFVLAPAIIAYYYAPRPSALVLASIVVNVTSCLVGFSVAYTFAQPIVATIVCVMGIFLLISAVSAPEKGLIHQYITKKENRKLMNENIFLVFVLQNELVNNIANATEYLKWKPKLIQATISQLVGKGLISLDDNVLILTKKGEQIAQKSLLCD